MLVTEVVTVALTNFVNTMGGGGKEGMLEGSHLAVSHPKSLD